MKFELNKVGLAPLALAVMLSGCALKPEQVDPSVSELPASFRTVSVAVEKTTRDYARWPTLYNDAVLTQLLEQTVSEKGSSLDVALAKTKLEQAEAAVNATRSRLWPTLAIGSTGERTGQRTGSDSVHTEGYALSTTLRYDLDIWGKAKNAIAADDFRAEFAAQAVEAMRKRVTHQVVTQYWVIRQTDAELRLMENQIAAREEQLKINQQRQSFGLSTQLEVKQAKARLANLQRQHVALKAERDSLEETLAELVGNPSLRIAEISSTSAVTPLGAIADQMPLMITTQRSDVKQAEADMQAAGLDVAMARAAMYPSISISGKAGVGNESFAALLSTGNPFWALGFSVDLPLFDRGLRLSQIERAKAVQRESVIAYMQTVRSAFHEVNRALLSLQSVDQSVSLLNDELEAAQKANELAKHQYDAGLIDYSQLLDVQQDYDDAQRASVKQSFERRLAEAQYLSSLGF